MNSLDESNATATRYDERQPLLANRHVEGGTRVKFRKIMQQIVPQNCVHCFFVFIFVPLGFLSKYLCWSSNFVFILNLLAIFPLSQLVTFIVTSLFVRPRLTRGILLKVTLQNSVMLILSITALSKGETRIVQLSMIGSILANLLLVVGFCFLVGGIRHHDNIINPVFASTASSLLNTACAALVIPAAMFAQRKKGQKYSSRIAALSRGTAIILLAVFVVYLLFRHTTHAVHFEESTPDHRDDQDEPIESLAVEEPEEIGTARQRVISILIRVSVLAGAGMLVISCAQFMFATMESGHLEKRFVGLILLPLIAEGPERLRAVNFAYHDRMAKAIEFAIERSMHTALYVTPMTILFSWSISATPPMTLQFGIFETIALFLSVLLVSDLIRDGKSTYLEGTICLGIYAIIAMAFQFLPEET